ncbi:hypothetical protein DFH08DRAFT_1090270 [Mycena albidolilacea]|uniref:Uncharacterized protein n=1 Tax=Mycena albidolilacea TaxID=1033008 RepID=A0AAD6YYI3_9AGAR|nr:hypothetical protein DFH08DRAFT_1090270 [Mycena albidolilacea]
MPARRLFRRGVYMNPTTPRMIVLLQTVAGFRLVPALLRSKFSGLCSSSCRPGRETSCDSVHPPRWKRSGSARAPFFQLLVISNTPKSVLSSS